MPDSCNRCHDQRIWSGESFLRRRLHCSTAKPMGQKASAVMDPTMQRSGGRLSPFTHPLSFSPRRKSLSPSVPLTPLCWQMGRTSWAGPWCRWVGTAAEMERTWEKQSHSQSPTKSLNKTAIENNTSAPFQSKSSKQRCFITPERQCG